MLLTEIPDYELKELISQRNGNKVYRAIHTPSNREVALKVRSFHPDAAHASSVNRLLSQAKISTSFNHINIANLHDAGRHKNLHYHSMNYFNLGSLREKLDQEVIFSNELALDILLQLSLALKYTHDRGYIHRNIKPENIFFSDSNHIVLADFGIVKRKNNHYSEAISDDSPSHYMAPEQALDGHDDMRSDLYGLGVIFYELVAGKFGHNGNKNYLENFNLIQNSIADIESKTLKPFLKKILSKNPNERFQTIDLVISKLKKLKHTSPQNYNKKVVNKKPKKNYKLTVLTSFLLLSLIPAFAVQIKQDTPPPEQKKIDFVKNEFRTKKIKPTMDDIFVENTIETPILEKSNNNPDMLCILNLVHCAQNNSDEIVQKKPTVEKPQKKNQTDIACILKLSECTH